VTIVEGEYVGGCLGEPAWVEEGGSELWEDGVREEIGVEDWQEEGSGGRQTEPMRSTSKGRIFGRGVRKSFEF
jgi:hypothetical protein